MKTFLITLSKKSFFCLFIVFLSMASYQLIQLSPTSINYLDKNGKKQILQLPVKDKKRLFDMMRILFAENHFAYTLLGSKPVSWEFYRRAKSWKPSFFDSPLESHHRVMNLGWNTWLKYAHLFPSAPFRFEESVQYSKGVSILIINEEAFVHVVNKYNTDFQDILGKEKVNGLMLLDTAAYHSLLEDALQSHQALTGMILGYGRENSWAFLRSCETMIPVGNVWGDDDWQDAAMKTRAHPFTVEESLAIEACPSFAGYPKSEESMALKKDYLETRQRILDYYKDRDFLEATLSLLAGFRPEEPRTSLSSS